MPEPDSELARALWQKWVGERVARVAPPLLLSEGVSVIRNRTHRKLIPPDEAGEMVKAYLGLPIAIAFPEGLVIRAWELATRFNRPAAYDSHYLALAEMLGCEFWTADERLFNAVSHDLPWVKFLKHFKPAESVSKP